MGVVSMTSKVYDHSRAASSLLAASCRHAWPFRVFIPDQAKSVHVRLLHTRRRSKRVETGSQHDQQRAKGVILSLAANSIELSKSRQRTRVVVVTIPCPQFDSVSGLTASAVFALRYNPSTHAITVRAVTITRTRSEGENCPSGSFSLVPFILVIRHSLSISTYIPYSLFYPFLSIIQLLLLDTRLSKGIVYIR